MLNSREELKRILFQKSSILKTYKQRKSDFNSFLCIGSAATHLYNPLGGAYYRSYECVLLGPDSRLRTLSGM